MTKTNTQTKSNTKADTLLEYVVSGNARMRIDRAAGLLHEVKILGLVSRNHRIYPESTLRDAVPLYENAKVNLNHPETSPKESRKYQDRFGVMRNVHLRRGEGLFADFHFNPKHRLAEQLLWDAENAPENVGFSHNVQAIIALKNGEQIVEKIEQVRSVDLVADPATTLGLFEHHQNSHEMDPGDEIVKAAHPSNNNPAGENPSDNATESLGGDSAEKVPDEKIPAKVALLTRLVESLLDAAAVPFRKNAEWNREFLPLLLNTDDPLLAERLLDERLRLFQRIDSAMTESLPAEPILSSPPRAANIEPISTDEFVQRISQKK